MKGRTITSWLYLGLSFVTLYLVSLELVPTCLSGTDANSPWHPLINVRSNEYHLWSVDRLTSYLTDLLTKAAALVHAAPLSALLVQASIFYIGSLAVVLSLRPTRGIPKPNILFLSSVPVLLTVLTIGWDAVVLGIFAWAPLLAVIAATLLVAQRRGLGTAAAPLWIFGAFVSFQHAASANHMALLSAMSALGLAYALATKDLVEESPPPEIATTDNGALRQRFQRLPIVPLLTLLPALLMTFYLAPMAPFPDYPPTAHLVPDDGIEGVIRPLVGRDYPIPVMDREVLQEIHGRQALILLALAASAWLLTRKVLRRRATYVAVAAVFTLGATVLDTKLPEQFAAIAPIMSAARLLPWGTTFCITSIVLAAGAWLLGVVLVTNPQRQVGSGILAIAIASMGYLEIQQTALRQAERAYLLHPELQKIAVSPSAALLLREHRATGVTAETFLRSARASAADMQSIGSLQPQLEGAPRGSAKTLQRMTDGKEATVWSTGGTHQTGSEYLSVAFTTPIKMRAIQLDTGARPTDFPRGLSIHSGSCNTPGDQLAAYPTWQGAVGITESGYPFFQGQQDVRIAFAESKELSGLCIRQTATSEFEWTVAELRYLAGE
jgi:hypothetical protein